jgi:hypothetical protein
MNTILYRIMVTVKAFALMLFVFGLLAWLYGITIQITHPEWLTLPISHLITTRLDTFTIIMFILSAVGFFVWRLIVELQKEPQK